MKLGDKIKDLFLEDISEHKDQKRSTSVKIPENFVTSFKEVITNQFVYYLALIPVLALAWFVRTRNLIHLQGKYLLGLDPYVFYRYAGYILENGKLMVVDMMRYVPVGHTLHPSDIFFSYVLAYWYKLLEWTGMTQMEFHIIYPVLAGIIGLLFFFLFVRELFGNKVALVSTAFAAVIPAYIYRTGAGFADHEAMGMLFMLASLWLFAIAWKNKSWKGLEKISNKLKLPDWISLHSIIFGVGAGVLAGCMILTWGGYKYLLSVIGLFILATLLFSKIEKRRVCVYIIWFASILPFLAYRFSTAGWLNSFKSVEGLLLLFALASVILYLLIPKLKLDLLEKYLPRGGIAVVVSGIVGIICAMAFNIITISGLIDSIAHPMGTGRLTMTVSENAQPFFLGGPGWWSSFGWTFVLVALGSIFLVYLLFKGDNKYAIPLSGAYTIFLLAFVFGRYSTNPKHAELVRFFSEHYLNFLAFFVIIVMGIYIYSYIKDKENHAKTFNVNWQLLLVFVWFLFALIIARGAIRTIFALAPVAALVAGLFIVRLGEWMWNRDDIKWGIVILAIFAIFCFASNANSSYLMSSGSGYPGPWEDSYEWIKENTPEDAVIEHWWDYGYWTQTMGERASVVDGGNVMGWDHQTGRYGLLGRDPNNYLSYLKTHNVTHLLISREEIGKFHAFSTIGSDENWDLRSSVGIFSLQQQKEVRNGTQLIYSGGWPLDKDYVVGDLVLPEGQAYIGGFSFIDIGEGLTNSQVYIFNNEQQYSATLTCVCQAGKCTETEAENAFPGCLVLLPNYDASGQGNSVGSGFFISEKVKDTNLVRLYIIGEEIEYFKEVYNDNTPFGLYAGNIIGPIRIWEMQYPEWVETDDKYMERSQYG